MTRFDDYPFLRNVKSPITDVQLRPLDPRCRCVQFDSPLTESDHAKLAEFLGDYPTVPLRVYGHYSRPLPNLSFLRHYPFLSGFQVDVYHLETTEGIEELPESLEFFAFGQTKTRRISLGFLKRFSRLKELYLEGHTKTLDVISDLSHLEELTLRSISLPDLTLLLPLRHLWSLDIKLGGTTDLRLLPLIGELKYLELWMIRGLQDLSVIAEVTTLQNLLLQALKNVTALPSFRPLRCLRRVTLDTMKGLTDLSPVADAPALEELFVFAGNQLKPDDFRPFLGHPTLKAAVIGLGSLRKNDQVREILSLSDYSRTEFTYG
ncbi:MAG TPA: hypothetical protein VGM51_01485 [Armatimonadota bacterium]|jgi:hypothetical protein